MWYCEAILRHYENKHDVAKGRAGGYMQTMVQGHNSEKKNFNYVFPLKNDASPNRDLLSRPFGGGDSDTENPMRVSLLALAICLAVGRWLDNGTASMKVLNIGAVVDRGRGTCVESKSFGL